MTEKYYTTGTVTDLETDKVYKLGGVNVIQACLNDMVTKERKDCVTHVTGGNGLIAIEDENGRIRIEEVVSKDGVEGLIPKTTSTLVAYDIKDYMRTNE